MRFIAHGENTISGSMLWSPAVTLVSCSGYTARPGTAGASTPRPRSVPNWTG
jgi:hypothetical protein